MSESTPWRWESFRNRRRKAHSSPGHDDAYRMLAVSTDATSSAGSIVLVWSAQQRKPDAFIDSLLSLDPSRLIVLLPQLLFFYLENTYFSEEWWNGLTDAQQSHIRHLAVNPDPYYSEQRFVRTRLTPLEPRSCLSPWRSFLIPFALPERRRPKRSK